MEGVQMLEFAILGILHEAPMHGYELRKRLHDLLGTLHAFSYGSLYPTLRRLLRAGLIVEEVPEEAEPARTWNRGARRGFKLARGGKERVAPPVAAPRPQTVGGGGGRGHQGGLSPTHGGV